MSIIGFKKLQTLNNVYEFDLNKEINSLKNGYLEIDRLENYKY